MITGWKAPFFVFLMASAPVISGCAIAPTASIPIPTSCVPPNAPTMPPVMPNAELAKLGDRELVLRIAAERLDLLSFGVQSEMILLVCR